MRALPRASQMWQPIIRTIQHYDESQRAQVVLVSRALAAQLAMFKHPANVLAFPSSATLLTEPFGDLHSDLCASAVVGLPLR